jgi:hypothetical protein
MEKGRIGNDTAFFMRDARRGGETLSTTAGLVDSLSEPHIQPSS